MPCGVKVSTINRHVKLSKKKTKKTSVVGRPPALTPKQIDRLVAKAEKMIEAADTKYRITIGMVIKALGFKIAPWTALKALHEKGIYFRTMREKPVRTTEDVEARKEFATKHKGKPGLFWTNKVHAYMDNKWFPV